MSKQGWIKLHRQLQGNWIWESDEPFDRRSAWIDLLLSVNHEAKKSAFGKEIILVEKGSLITSIRKLSEKWKWSRHKVSTFLNLLESDQMIIKKGDTSKTLISVLKYGVYQEPTTGMGDTKEPETGTRESHGGDTAGTRGDTNKNNKNNKNDKNEKKERESAASRRPTDARFPPLQEVTDYCRNQGLTVDPETFWNYQEARGWIWKGEAIKNWKAVLNVWERREKERPKRQDDQFKELERERRKRETVAMLEQAYGKEGENG